MPRGRSLERVLADHRAVLTRRHRISTAGQLVRFVDACGFCYAFTGREGDMPIPACFDHLATRSVDRMWGWMWEWKDELPEAGRLYYGKLLRRKPTFVSMEFLPIFYATFGRAGEEDEYLEDVRAGRVNDIGRRIYEALQERGETQTKRLRAALGITSVEGRREYAKAMEDLQRLMYVTRVRAVGEGREDYNYTYDLFTRRYPASVRAAGASSSRSAMRAVLRRAIEMAGAVEERHVARTFEWEPDVAGRIADDLERDGVLVRSGAGSQRLLVLRRLAKDIAA